MAAGYRGALLVWLLAVVVWGSGAQAPSGQVPPFPTAGPSRPAAERAGLEQPPEKHPKLHSQLLALARAVQQRGAAAAAAEAQARGLRVRDSQVQVVIESQDRQGASAAVAAAGGRVEAAYAHLVQALLPAAALEAVAAHPAVRYVRPPFRPVPAAVVDEGVAATNASAWQAAGLTGAGVKVGIIDLGFAGYSARQASGDLPAALTPVDFCGGQLATATAHGTAVAEIVYKMAPGAQLYLICIDTEVNLGQAKDYAKSQGISIVNHSVSWFNTSRGDGSGGPGTPDAIVADARASGILWVNAAGNYARSHWSGTFSDPDNNGWHNFAANDEGNTVFVPSGEIICVALKWDDWPVSSQDYDLYLKRSSDGVTVARSVNPQTGTQPPTEDLCYLNSGAAQNFYIAIYKYNATTTPRFDLFVDSSYPLEYQVAAGSITEPASSPNAMAAGAICWQNDALEPYSSRGPTIDGRTKPDIAGQDSVSTATIGSFTSCGSTGFAGTSAAAPHVAGAAALVKQANPGFGPAQLQAFLEGRAVDLGTPGKDNDYGAGKLWLGAPPATSSLPCDINRDGRVDIFDFNLLVQNFGKQEPGNPADCNGDGRVDIFDFNILVQNFGRRAS
ncbi:MAG TPA: S8 family serine peptidase [Chloroflexota bacterium]|nr:S8 family serine peptidase [Chloroflexota bacterium]